MKKYLGEKPAQACGERRMRKWERRVWSPAERGFVSITHNRAFQIDIYVLSQPRGWWPAEQMGTGRKSDIYPATITTVCTSLGTQTCPGTQHSRSGCDTALLLQDGAGLWKTTLFSLLCGKGFLLKESSSGGERHWEIILHLVLLPSHIWRKREIKQRRVGTHSILRAAEIGIITTLPEPPWDWAARGNYSPPPAPCEREDTLTSSSGEASKGSDGTGGRDCGCPWKLRQEKQFLFKLLIPPHCFLTIPQPSSRSLTLVQAVPCLLPQ